MSPRLLRGLLPRTHGAREGYPPLILGQHVFTNILVDIARAEPTWAAALPESAIVGEANVSDSVKRLAREGLVRRYESKTRRGRTASIRQLWLDRRRPYAAELYELLRAIGEGNGLGWPDARHDPPEDLDAITEDHHATKHPEHLFGTKQRTTAIVLLHLVPSVDATTVARVAGMNENESALNLYLRDGIAVSEVAGAFRLYSANPNLPWAPQLRRLVERLAELVPRYASLAAAAEKLRVHGTDASRTYLRNRLERQQKPGKP